MNQAYPKGFEAFGSRHLLGTQIDLVNDTLKFQAVTAAYVFSTAHQFLSDLTNTVGSPSSALTSLTYTGGVLRASPALISAFPNGANGFAVVLYDLTVMNALIAYYDTGNGFPWLGTGGDVDIVCDPLQYGFFQG